MLYYGRIDFSEGTGLTKNNNSEGCLSLLHF